MIDWLFTNAVAAMALALIAVIVIRTFRPSPAVRHALWLVVVLKLVSPTGLMLSVPLPVEPPESAVTKTPQKCEESPNFMVQEELFTVVVEPRPGQTAEEAALAAMPQASTQPVESIGCCNAATTASAKPFDYRPLLLVCWLAGATFVAVRQLRETMRFARFARRSHPAGEELLAEVAIVAQRLGVSVPSVRVLSGLSSPVMWCLFKPVLLWPAGLDCRLKGEGRRAVLAHELAHLRRRDHWARRLEMLAAVLHWWNPLFWVARRKMRADAELACDAWAAGQADRRAYAEALLEVCSFHPRRRPAPAVGVVGEGRHAMQERLTMIMRERVPCRLAFGAKLIVALMAIAAVPAWTLGQAAPVAAPPAADPQVQAIEAQIQALTQKLEAMKASKRAEAEKSAAESALKAQEVLGEKLKELHLRLNTGVAETKSANSGVKVLSPAQGAVKVIGADGKELKDVKVIILDGKHGERTVTVQPLPTVAAPVTKPLPAGVKPTTVTTPDGGKVNLNVAVVRQAQVTPLALDFTSTWVGSAADAGNSITLSRATYKIGKDQSAALASLLGSIKATVMETKVDGDSITVTTTPEAQRAIGQIVQLMKGADAQGRTFEFRYLPLAPATPPTPATPAAPASPKDPLAPKAPATPKPASFEFKVAEPKDFFELRIEPVEEKFQERVKPGNGLRLTVPADGPTRKTESKLAEPVKP